MDYSNITIAGMKFGDRLIDLSNNFCGTGIQPVPTLVFGRCLMNWRICQESGSGRFYAE
ncbi:hypothetical protein [Microcoleus anatoxicus]|uniref:hypothetical protein n=1 Tax=Microcoleus anatoxicus TaxID=2705319 RepID=UPI0030C9A8CC